MLVHGAGLANAGDIVITVKDQRGAPVKDAVVYALKRAKM